MQNIFHTYCHVQNKVCSLIIDNRNCVNIASTIIVSKLNLCMIEHNKPYRLQFLNDCGEVKVTKQVLILFFIRKYVDKVQYDVVLMHVSHILLERPWQSNRKAKHDKFKNRYSLKKDGRTYTLAYYHQDRFMKTN